MRPLVLSLSLLATAACMTAPASRGPLSEALASAESTQVESAVRGCLKKDGWKVDDIGSYSGGANVVTAYKAKDQTDVYIYGAETKPRITGGPDVANPFWKCLGSELTGHGSEGDSKDAKDKDGSGSGGEKPGKTKDEGAAGDKPGGT